jgi:hypothetical protein
MVGCLKAFCGRNAFFCNYLKELNGFKKGEGNRKGNVHLWVVAVDCEQ